MDGCVPARVRYVTGYTAGLSVASHTCTSFASEQVALKMWNRSRNRMPCHPAVMALCLVLVLASSNGALAQVDLNQAPKQAPPLDQMIERLRLRLESEPEDMQGWVLLGRSYEFVGQNDEARIAFERARALGYSGEVAAPAATGKVDPQIMGDISRTIHDAQGTTAPVSGDSPR